MPHPPSPALYGWLHEPGASRVLLLLEDLAPRYVRPAEPVDAARLAQAAGVLARLHAHWWDHPRLTSAALRAPQGGLSRFCQALAPGVVRRRMREAAPAVAAFADRHRGDLGTAEARLLDGFAARWGERFARRIRLGALTLCHGDFHPLGNVFFPHAGSARPRVVDWPQHRRGLGPHDLAYCLLAADTPPDERRARDLPLLRRYHAGLVRGGVRGYAWEQCEWDYRFSLLGNLFQAFLHGSFAWFVRTLRAARAWNAEATLA
ncbi:MAG TPA: hypothetical protein VFX98_18625 [Longimicrobiaceae bacterium]|nr:hypothetical protein [Longimicrobiaceae bacterium]